MASEAPTAAAAASASSGGAAFRTPLRHIFDHADLTAFNHSPVYNDFLKFITAINHAIADKPNNAACHVSPVIDALLMSLAEMARWVDEIPPLAQPMRYGNKAYRQWHDRLIRNASDICKTLIAAAAPAGATAAASTAATASSSSSGGADATASAAPAPAAAAGAEVELVCYLYDAFGNATRIDYGTGHETMFIIFLYCCAKVGLVVPADLPALGIKVFPAYLALVHKLQKTYWLEPAGSHGVWSLDDYQFLAFLFGSSQLLNHKHLKPRSVLSADTVEAYAHQYTYLECIAFIKSVKTGAPFAETSPILNDIANLPSWAKINEGLAKMYVAEVLGKLPVVQHIVFGTLFPASWTPSREPLPSEATAHALAVLAGVSVVSPSAGTPTTGLQALEAAARAATIPVDEPDRATAPWITSPPHASGSPITPGLATASGATPGASPGMIMVRGPGGVPIAVRGLPASGAADPTITGVAPWARSSASTGGLTIAAPGSGSGAAASASAGPAPAAADSTVGAFMDSFGVAPGRGMSPIVPPPAPAESPDAAGGGGGTA